MTNAPKTIHEPVDFVCAGAKFRWEDGKITGRFNPLSLEFWNAVIGFHRAVSIKHNAESVSYHKWHEETGEYHTIIPWQESQGAGLHVHTNWASKQNVELLDEYARRFGRDFFPACTIHTHVDTSAFESGTDAHDESENPGWHITLGRLISFAGYDISARMRAPKKRALNEVMSTRNSFKLQTTHLFDPETNKQINTIPGTTDWHHFLDRVQIL